MKEIIQQGTFTLPGIVNYFLLTTGAGIFSIGVAAIIREMRLWK